MTSQSGRPELALLIDPRFPGGTASAVAQEIRALRGRFDLRVHALETRMFKGRDVNPTLRRALDDAGLDLIQGDAVIRAPVVVLHNPSCLKFDQAFPARVTCDTLIAVTHENFLRPDGTEGFDVGHCLDLIDRAAVARARRLCPVSAYNRGTVQAWLDRSGSDWRLAGFDWFNICDFEMVPPTAAPADRRGRHSRPGPEKFPPLAAMRRHFPPQAQACRILGADSFLLDPDQAPPHWEMLPFGAMPVAEFLEGIDFFVYFTHPQLRESFGRVLAEAVCAGKLVITDPGTAAVFGEAVHPSEGDDVDAIVAGYVADPAAYGRFVERAQQVIRGFGPDRFTAAVQAGLQEIRTDNDALL